MRRLTLALSLLVVDYCYLFPIPIRGTPCDVLRQDDRCRCGNEGTEMSCCCVGMWMNSTPSHLGPNITKLIMKRVGLTEIRGTDFRMYSSLVHLEISQAPHLVTVDADAFASLFRLKKLSITDCPRLERVNGTLLRNNRDLLTLEIRRTALSRIPKMEMISSRLALPNVDFSENEIATIETGDAENVFLSLLRLSHNRISRIGDFAFKNSKIFLLRLDNNPLTEISLNAFADVSALTKLDLSYAELRSLPEEGLGRVEELSIEHAPHLKQLPPLVVFMNLKVAHLTYPYHCCLFKYAATSRRNWKEHAKKYEGNLQEMREKYCFTQSPTSASVGPDTTTVIRDDVNWTMVEAPNVDAGSGYYWMTKNSRIRRRAQSSLNSGDFMGQFGTFYDDEEEYEMEEALQNDAARKEVDAGYDQSDYGQLWGPLGDAEAEKSIADGPVGGISHGIGWEPAPVSLPKVVVPCVDGDRSVNEYYAKVKCSPQPDPLNPCEDVMIGWHLRILIFFVWTAAIAGNLLVIVLLVLTNQPRQRVNNFLMINLAFADLCTGVYLAMIGIEDVMTKGEYYNYAVEWQTGWGCKIAGTLAVFASELSIITMVMISFEVWYNTKHAIFQKRLQLSTTFPLLLFGWIFACTMASLPLIGVSDYSVTSTCLPLRMDTPTDRIYLLVCLGLNVLGFAFIVFNYVSVYCTVARSMAATAHIQDMALAKLMFCLIFTDFLCWAPTVFFGLTAAAELPLISISMAKVFLVVFYPLNAFANPWLYVFLTKRFRMNMARFVRKRVWLREFLFNVLRHHQSHSSGIGSNNYFYHSQPHNVTQTTNVTSQRSSPSTCSSALVTPRGSKTSFSTSNDTPRGSNDMSNNETASLLSQSVSNVTNGTTANGIASVAPRRKSTARFRPQMSDIIESSNSNSAEDDHNQSTGRKGLAIIRPSVSSLYESLAGFIAKRRASKTSDQEKESPIPMRSMRVEKSGIEWGIETEMDEETRNQYAHLYYSHPALKNEDTDR